MFGCFTLLAFIVILGVAFFVLTGSLMSLDIPSPLAIIFAVIIFIVMARDNNNKNK